MEELCAGWAKGMSAFTDVIDWVGGLPFEVAKPEEIFDFFAERNFVLKGLRLASGIGTMNSSSKNYLVIQM